MRYMLLVYVNEKAREGLQPEEQARRIAYAQAVIKETTERGIFKGADPLEPTSAATTVRVANGEVMITDGPFAETKEQLGGYFILECKDLDEALDWAAKIPASCGTGCVEVRPIREMQQRVDIAISSNR
jgi:hypothetical protein